ncbi:MAG: right-handed parallel beta-helix repeat-containing protein, partial [bacterium]|nr:right-handed parallel beta-helix repeat-containing protein [bacterium]
IAGNKAVYGGGLHSCHGNIEENTIMANESGEGGGLFDCDGPISHNTIPKNKTVEYSYTDNNGFHVVEPCGGGGLAYCDGTIRNNLVADNTGAYTGAGGGFYRCKGTIEFNAIRGNYGGYRGGGLSYCDGTIRNNLIIENVSAVYGGGLAGCNGTILNNTIAHNRASLHGGGLYQCKGTISNCIIWGNEPAIGGEQVFDCSIPAYSCIEDWTTGQGQGNIAFEPYFADADLHLSPWSPCVDAGDPASAFGSEPEPNGGRIDMGAYGNTSEATSRSPDADEDGLPDDWELLWFSSLEERPEGDPDNDNIPNLGEYRLGYDPTTKQETRVANVTRRIWHATIESAITEASDGDEIVVYPGVYNEQVGFGGKNVVLRSTDPLDPAIVAATVIDGNGAPTIVRFRGSEGESCILAGFTIRNCEQSSVMESAAIFGGAWRNGTHAIIRNNVIRDTGADGMDYCDGIIENNAVENNEGTGLASCGAEVRNNTITGNRRGGLWRCYGLIEGNLIANNSWTGGYGGGLSDCDGVIRGNTISDNSAYYGGGLSRCNRTIQNCIIWGNTAPQLNASSIPTYSCIQDWTGVGERNIASEPQFLDLHAGDYRLQEDSPCIDAGHNDPGLPSTDIAGMHRIMFGGKSLTVDVGAYEFHINKLEPVPGAEAAILTWSSLAGMTYSILYTDDLFNWRIVIADIASSGNRTMSWLDDGSLTGVPPLLAPKRFYRILENP